MKQILIVSAVAMTLAGCAPNNQLTGAITEVDNVLVNLAEHNIPRACGVIAVAEGYYANVRPYVPARQQLTAARAMAAAKVICDHPPTNVVAAFRSLAQAWVAIQAATTVPG